MNKILCACFSALLASSFAYAASSGHGSVAQKAASYAQKADKLMQAGYYAEAEKNLDKAVEIQPGSPKLYAMRAYE